jgi:acyl phosphate:glycerol-3-phosphate acyltransferase
VSAALLVIVSYLVGAIPTSYIAGRLVRGIDLRQHGSGNLGATNAFRVLGWRAAVPTFLADTLKGFLPVFLFPRIDSVTHFGWALAYGVAAILGHVYSIYVGFKGGKGVATSAGVFLALAPLAMLFSLVLWIGLVAATGYVSLASIVAAAAMPLLVLATGAPTAVLVLSALLAAFVIFAHRTNIRRLARGEEHRFRRRGATVESTR